MQTNPQLFILAFVFVLALIGLAAWLVRRFSGKGGGGGSRGRAPRLAVIDAAAVDNRRRLVLVRRDNIEHLLMIGGPTDIVVESHIVRGASATGREPNSRDQAPRTNDLSRVLDTGVVEPEAAPAAVAAAEPSLTDFAPRPPRPLPDDIRRPGATERPGAADRRGDLSAHAEPIIRPEPSARPEPRLEPRSEPQPARTGLRSEPLLPRAASLSLDSSRVAIPRANIAPPPQPAPVVQPPAPAMPPATPAAPTGEFASEAEQNLADMAKRLEAALRRPAAEPAPAPELRVSPEPRFPQPGQGAAPPVQPPTQAPSIKTGFENLEDEMASLLGRPKSNT